MSSPWSRCVNCQLVFQAALPARCPGCGADVPAPQATPESVSYYAVRDRKKVGPLTLAQMRDLASAGQLGPDDMVLPHGGRTWLPARQVGGLFPETAMPETVDQAAPTAPHQPSPSLAAAGTARLPGAPVVPGYEIEGELGRGGMGVVYRARQVALKRPVALKMILSGGHAGPQELARFRAEAESVARLTHPNIVQVYETGQHNGLPYFSLEFVDGGTLAKRLAGTPQPPRSAAGLLTVLARAIQAAHDKGIVHRDLKPANILLTQAGVPKITDFGLAKQLDQSGQTHTGAVMGTPSYMAPEQARGQVHEIGPLCDLYALGAILYETLTGRPPFKGATVLDTLEQVRNREPVPPSVLEARTPRDLETICLKCLDKEPGKRYGSAGELADDLDRYLEGRPILARPAGVVERAGKFVRRNKLLVGSAASVFSVLLGGIVVSLAFLVRATRAEEVATKRGDALEEEKKKLAYQLAEEASARGQAEAQRGELRKALPAYQRALGYYTENLSDRDPKVIQTRLAMARAHIALSEHPEVRKILDQLPPEGDHEGQVLLMRGTMTMGSNVEAGFALVEQALEKRLPLPEEFYARALLAKESPDAVDKLKKALEEDRNHYQARSLLCLLLVMLGRSGEAGEVIAGGEALYPQDPNFKVIRAVQLALKGDRREAERVARQTEKQMDPRYFKVFLKILGLLDYMARIDVEAGNTEDQQLLKLWSELAPELHVVWPAPGSSRPRPTSEDPQTRWLLEMPPVLTRALNKVASAMAGLAPGKLNDQTMKQLNEALRAHPEGTLYFFYAYILNFNKCHKEAEREATTATRLPAMGKIKQLAHLVAADSAVHVGEAGDPDAFRRATFHVVEAFRLGPPRAVNYETLLRGVLRSGNLIVARRVLGAWELTDGPEDPGVLRGRLHFAREAGLLDETVRAAEGLLKKKPGDAEAIKERQEALTSLGKLVRDAAKP